MRCESNLISELWTPETIEKLRLRGCGLINFRSRSGDQKSIREEIQQIIDHKLDAGKTEKWKNGCHEK